MKILGYNYELRAIAEKYDNGHAGSCNLAGNVILISDMYNQQRTESTVLHEIIEALNYNLEIDLEHKAITQIESGLYQVLTDAGVDLAPLTAELKRNNQ